LFQITVPWFMRVLMARTGTRTLPAAVALDGLDTVDVNESVVVYRLPNIILPSGFLLLQYPSSLTKAPNVTIAVALTASWLAKR
jgi:hypothetical protein